MIIPVRTPKAVRCQQRQIFDALPQVIAQCEFDELAVSMEAVNPDNGASRSYDGQGFPITIYLSVDTPAPSDASTSVVQWKIEWGYGGNVFSQTVSTIKGKFVKVASWVRVSAQLVALGTANITTKATVSAMCVPGLDGNPEVPSLIEHFATALGTMVLKSKPVSLLRISGYVSGVAGTDYLFLVNKATSAGSGDAVARTLGAVVAGSTFSLDLYGSGQDFNLGLSIMASTTVDPGTTLDASAVISCDLESKL